MRSGVADVSAIVVVGGDRDPLLRPPQDLTTDTDAIVELRIRLPPVDDPGLDLQTIGRKHLHAQPVEEPGRIVRCKRRLVRPVLRIVVRKEPDVGHEETGINIDPVPDIEVISRIGLAEVAIRIREIELSVKRAEVVAWNDRCTRAELK